MQTHSTTNTPSRKAAQTQSRISVPDAVAMNDIAITGYGLNCLTGDQDFMLFSAVATNMGFARPDPVLEAPTISGEGVENIMTCAMDNLYANEPSDRMLECMTPALDQAVRQAGLLDAPVEKLLLHIAVPPNTTERGSMINVHDWRDLLTGVDTIFETAEVRIVPCTDNVTAQLLQVIRDWPVKQWDCVIFGAVDSLLDELTSTALAKQLRIQTAQTSDGVVPGEAAAFLVLERNNANTPIKPLAWLRGLAIDAEPHSGQADLRRLKGLVSAMQKLTTQTSTEMKNIGAIVQVLGTEMNSMLEWHQVETSLWPTKLSEQQRVAMQLGEIDPPEAPAPLMPEKLNLNLSLGDVGVAGPVAGILLAMGRLGFKHPQVKHVLITEGGENKYRGAMLIKAVEA